MFILELTFMSTVWKFIGIPCDAVFVPTSLNY